MVFLYLCMEHLVRTKENSVAGAVDRRHSKDWGQDRNHLLLLELLLLLLLLLLFLTVQVRRWLWMKLSELKFIYCSGHDAASQPIQWDQCSEWQLLIITRTWPLTHVILSGHNCSHTNVGPGRKILTSLQNINGFNLIHPSHWYNIITFETHLIHCLLGCVKSFRTFYCQKNTWKHNST